MKPLLTQAEVAKILRCHPNTVARLRNAGEIAFLPGTPVKFRPEDVERWLLRNLTRRVGHAAKREAKAAKAARRSIVPQDVV